MKVYVDELPKSCNNCPCRDDTFCNLYWETKKERLSIWDAIFNKERDEQCHLQSLGDYTKQVRKEVCEEFREKLIDGTSCEILPTGDICITLEKINNVLDQIQGESTDN